MKKQHPKAVFSRYSGFRLSLSESQDYWKAIYKVNSDQFSLEVDAKVRAKIYDIEKLKFNKFLTTRPRVVVGSAIFLVSAFNQKESSRFSQCTDVALRNFIHKWQIK